MNFQLTPELIQKIKLLIENKNQSNLIALCEELLPQDIAEILQSLNFENCKYLFELLNDEKNADILIELEEELREKLVEDYSSKEIVKDVIENLESDDAADFIQELSDKKQKEVLSKIINPQQASDLADLLSYKENSAGALMAKELIKVYENWSILRCVSEMRQQAQYVNNVYTIYVVDKHSHLIGTVSLKKLLLTPEKTFISQIYNDLVVSVTAGASGEEVARIMTKYDLIVLPVVNKNNELIGRITIDDVVDFIQEEAEKDYQMASGISDNIEPIDNVLTLTKARIPWLIIGMIGGLVGAQIIGFFDIAKNPLLALFIPLITAMAGNVGVQSSAIIVQGLATKNLGLDNWLSRFIKEFKVALINGLICCCMVFLVCFSIYQQTLLPFTISISLLSVMIFAAIFGTFTPLILNQYKIDPALATGPFITTINDVVGLLIYFLITDIML